MADAKKIIPETNYTYNNSLSYYLNEISKIPLLTREEEEDLALRAKNGDRYAKERLVKSNLRFVVSVAKQYRNQGIPLSDLINEGNIGLLTAIDKFDVTMGYHFISYAVWWIRQAILKAICEKSRLIRLPLNRANELIQIVRERKRLEIEKGEDPSIMEIADNLDYDKDLVQRLMDVSRETVSLETPVFENKRNSSYLSDFLEDRKFESPERTAENTSLNEVINSLLKTLTEKEKAIIEYRFGLNGQKQLSLKEIGKKYNLTKERIRQIEKKALSRLRHSTRKDKLATFMVS
ncbi:MAG: RNA polymerase sigma factor RpoD/SigA [Spirochaetes bacterium]|nr:RNA polymerase sigma factor RpoD/SigA [Spirochaetota bacterium]